MFETRSTLNSVMLMLAICGLVFVIGCGASQEQQAMSEFLLEYGKAVDEYSAADNGKKAEIVGTVDSFKDRWTNMKIEMGSEITPQTLDKLDNEYQAITKKFASIAGKS